MINLAVLFGGRSVEHEISIISAVQAIQSLDTGKYNVIPIYMAKDGRFYTGSPLMEISNYKNMSVLLKQCKMVIVTRDTDGVYIYEKKGVKIGKKAMFRIDAVLPVVHGTNCEDGTLQGWLEMLDIPYAGCSVAASAIGMDKEICKKLMRQSGVPVLNDIAFFGKEWIEFEEKITERIEKELGYPIIVKPVNLGSSVGISKASDREELKEAVKLAMNFAERILVEPAIKHLREINCSVLGDAQSCRASVCEEPIMSDKILSYEDKYMSSGKSGKAGGSKGMESMSRVIPADLPKEKSEEIAKTAQKAFKSIGGSGVVRIDFLIDTDDNNKIYLNEINTIPGSLSFYLWEKSGLTYTQLLDELVDLAFARARRKSNLSFTFDTNILSGDIKLGGKKGKL